MDLFNAATMGVDPQTGTYLSKEQRVAMFRASRGQGGGNGGGSTRGGNSYVKPQSAMIVAEKMTGIVQTLSQNFQNTTQGVAEQVAQNRKDIDNLYNMYEAEKAQQAKLEQQETRKKRLEIGQSLRAAREKMIEGLSSAAAGLANAGGSIAKKALQPVMGFWGKIKRAFLALAGMWVIDNLPQILGFLENFQTNLGEFKDTFTESLSGVRGVWSLLDKMLGGIIATTFKISKTALDVSVKIGRKATEIAGKVLRAIGNFALNVAKKIVDGIGKLWNRVSNLIKPPAAATPETPRPTGGGPDTPKVQTKVDPSAPKTPQPPKGGKGNMFSGIGDWFKNTFGGAPKADTPPAPAGTPQLPEGAKEAKRVKWLEDALAPVTKAFPALGKGMKGFAKLAKGILRVVPGIGFAIDLALNKGVAGQDWTQAIIRALGSSIVGGLSAAAGMKAGALAGAGLGTLILPVGGTAVGAAIGAALGGIIAGMAGGAAGDLAGAAVFEGVTGQERTGPDPLGAGIIKGAVGMLQGDPSLSASDASQKVELNVGAVKSGASTPSGMSMTEAAYDGKALLDVIELPPVVTDMRKADAEPQADGEVAGPPTIATADPEMDIYRAFSANEYMMVF